MKVITWKDRWPRHEDFFEHEKKRLGKDPLMDLFYFRRFDRWLEKTYNCKIVTTQHGINGNTGVIYYQKRTGLIFENDDDATMFLLRM